MVLGERLETRPLADRFRTRSARVGIIGLGYAGRSPVSDVQDGQLRPLVREGLLHATDDYAALATVDAVVICVPTPLARGKRPDLSYVEAAARGISRYLHPDM